MTTNDPSTLRLRHEPDSSPYYSDRRIHFAEPGPAAIDLRNAGVVIMQCLPMGERRLISEQEFWSIEPSGELRIDLPAIRRHLPTATMLRVEIDAQGRGGGFDVELEAEPQAALLVRMEEPTQ